MEEECVIGPIHFLCLDCWGAYFQVVDEIPSAPFRGECSTCRYNLGPLIPCKSDSPLARRRPWWDDENNDRRSESFFEPFFGPGAVLGRKL